MRSQNIIDMCDPQFGRTERLAVHPMASEVNVLDPAVSPIIVPSSNAAQRKVWRKFVVQVLRFCIVGVLNTTLDLLLFNCLLWMSPTTNSLHLVIYNSFAYAFGGINSFILNKYWTFRHRQRIVPGEVARFIITTLVGICVNDVMLWLCSTAIHLQHVNPTLWANVSKVVAIFGTFLVSYVGMRVWVFARRS